MFDVPPVEIDEWIEVHDHAATSPVIIHAPHGGNEIPDWARRAFTCPDEELQAEQLALEDHFTDHLARKASASAGCSAVISTLSRFVIDVERFDGPEEEMLAVGMGMLYTHGTRRQRIRHVPPELDAALRRFYVAYGTLVTDLTARALAAHGHATIIDLHSYPALALPYERHSNDPRPPLSVGYEEPHMTPDLRRAVRNALDWIEQRDNLAFKGSYVPLRFLGSEPRVRSVMLEIRRDQYLDGPKQTVNREQLQRLAASLTELVSDQSLCHYITSST